MNARRARTEDTGAIIETIATSFHNDPVWSWAFPDPEQRPAQFRAWWRLFVVAGLRNEAIFVTGNCESVAVWAPPGLEELGPGELEQIAPMFTEMLGDHAPAVLEMLSRFDAARPHDEPHWYLSIVGTHDDHRGKGIGVALLRENLARIDELHAPAYLESSNPANHERYRRLGFEPIGGFEVCDGGPPVMTMWRAAR